MIHLEILRGLRAAATTAARESPLNKFAPILRSNSPAMADSFPSAKHASDRLEDSAAWGWRRTTATPPGPWSAPTWGWRAGSTGQDQWHSGCAADQRRQACDDHAHGAAPALQGGLRRGKRWMATDGVTFAHQKTRMRMNHCIASRPSTNPPPP